MNFTVSNNEIDRAIKIMKEVAAWGRSVGYRVWLDEWLTPAELLTSEVSTENFYVGQVNGIDASCMILQWSDKEWWPNAPLNEAGYIHKLCVRRDFASKGIPLKMIEYAKKECGKKGVKYLRLDTGWDEEKMKQIYISLGFEIIKKIELKNGKAMALYQLVIN
nr:GNAT family N-acetyltransferase [uncultured Niameybacter sp.]